MKVYITELTEDIERLARFAYPDAPANMIETIAKDQSLDALRGRFASEGMPEPAIHPVPSPGSVTGVGIVLLS